MLHSGEKLSMKKTLSEKLSMKKTKGNNSNIMKSRVISFMHCIFPE
jgi:hypothetical protein